MKHNQRLDYSRLAEVLHERGVADSDSLRELLHQSQTGGTPFTEALVTSNLIGDWDLSRIVCEIFNLPFLPVDVATPDSEALIGLNQAFLVENGLVPVGRFGQTLTVCMPALVPADVLAMLAAESEMVILPVVGTVQSNRRWIEEYLSADIAEPKTSASSSWGEMFDDADAAVLMDLEDVGGDGEDAEIELAIAELEEEEPSSLVDFEVEEGELDLIDDPATTSHESGGGGSGSGSGSGSGRNELPPMPEFG